MRMLKKGTTLKIYIFVQRLGVTPILKYFRGEKIYRKSHLRRNFVLNFLDFDHCQRLGVPRFALFS